MDEELLLIMKLKDLKEDYRSAHAELQELRAEVQGCQQLVDQCRNKLISGTRSLSEQPPVSRWCLVAPQHFTDMLCISKSPSSSIANFLVAFQACFLLRTGVWLFLT